MFGAHLSIAGGLINALEEAERLKFDCVQVFTKNQRQWRVPPLREEERLAWLDKLERLGWKASTRGRGQVRVVSHNSYLINLASSDAKIRKKSIALQRAELERCEALSIPCCVAHPGAHLGVARPPGQAHELGTPPSGDELRGLNRIVKALDQLHRELAGFQTVTCLETTAGSGSNLGYDFLHLSYIREQVRDPERVGFCFDTCHVTAAGYDMSTEAGAREVLAHWQTTCGLKHLRVIHANDSIGALGSRRDRHTHIGEGTCGRTCFAALVNHPQLKDVPKILETPKGTTAKGTPWDLINVRRLKRLAKAPESSR